jgi:hypothetical protein
MHQKPRRVSRRELKVNVTGYVSPFYIDNQPVLLNMSGTEDLFLALFSTPQKLEAEMARAGIEYDKIVKVTDGPNFLESVAFRVRVIVDPHLHGNGRVRFTELFLTN